MSKFNRRGPIGTTSPLATAGGTSEVVRTFEGGAAFIRDPKAELFTLAVSNMVGEHTHYENAEDRDTRYRQLIHAVTVSHVDWTARFLLWLRTVANMRSASVVGAIEAARALLSIGAPGGRQIIADTLRRADEPGEALAYWIERYGRVLPMPIKRGIADAAKRLYTEYTLLKYDTDSKAFRFGDVIELTHPKPTSLAQSCLFEHAINRRHGNATDAEAVKPLSMVRKNAKLRAKASKDPAKLLAVDKLKAAGMSWEDALSLAGGKLDKGELWEALIPSMGYMACLRNLRNFDQAGVSDAAASTVIAKLIDPVQVAMSRQLPMRFLSAYNAAPSDRWKYPLEQALTHSLASLPHFKGRTLILIDTSGSMSAPFSRDGTLMRWDAATLFGLALAQRCQSADVVSFSAATYGYGYFGAREHEGSKVFTPTRGAGILSEMRRFKEGGWFIGGGTDTPAALRTHYDGHDRIVILTDEQTHGNVDAQLDRSPNAWVYTWNLGGYAVAHGRSGSGRRHSFAGLSDAGFTAMALLEDRWGHGRWPF